MPQPQGENVKELQMFLNSLQVEDAIGNPIFALGERSKLPENGVYGPRTKEAVRKLQHALNSIGFACGAQDGLYGNKTRSAVSELLKAAPRQHGRFSIKSGARLSAPDAVYVPRVLLPAKKGSAISTGSSHAIPSFRAPAPPPTYYTLRRETEFFGIIHSQAAWVANERSEAMLKSVTGQTKQLSSGDKAALRDFLTSMLFETFVAENTGFRSVASDFHHILAEAVRNPNLRSRADDPKSTSMGAFQISKGAHSSVKRHSRVEGGSAIIAQHSMLFTGPHASAHSAQIAALYHLQNLFSLFGSDAVSDIRREPERVRRALHRAYNAGPAKAFKNVSNSYIAKADFARENMPAQLAYSGQPQRLAIS
jgi:hypothetical protein